MAKEKNSPGRGIMSRIWLAIREIIMVFIAAIVISAIIKGFLVQAFVIPSASMQNTLQINDRILVSKLVPDIRSLNRGDVVVFEDTQHWLNPDHIQVSTSPVKKALTAIGVRPDDSEQHLIKRVIGLPGDRVQCCDDNGLLVVNGVSIQEPYIKPGASPSDIAFDITVPADKLWVMGDNRANSSDSRFHMDTPEGGFIREEDVTGRAFVIMWPLSRWTTIDNTDAFAAVPSASEHKK